jgi:hypothetical protein
MTAATSAAIHSAAATRYGGSENGNVASAAIGG